jgi:predicted acetyltransferase
MSFEVSLIPATLHDYPAIQNMARFYVYDLSRECGDISDEWNILLDGLYESFDFKEYIESPQKEAYLIKANNILAGFVLLNKETLSPDTQWNMGEFFVLAKFQGKGIGRLVATTVFKEHPGSWEVSVIPENKSAAQFWRRIISDVTESSFQESMETVIYDPYQPKRIVFSFRV